MLRLKIFLGLFGLCLLCPVVAEANAVIDVYNHHRRQLLKNDRLKEYLGVMRKSDASTPPGSADIAAYVGLEYEQTAGGNIVRKLVDDTPYNCMNNVSFDGGSGDGKSCRDWALNGNDVSWIASQVQVKTASEHLQDIQKILGDTRPLDGTDDEHLSVAVEYMRCLTGTVNKGTVAEYNEVAACKNLVDWTSSVLLLKDLADGQVFENMFAPEKQYFVVREDGNKKVKNRPSEPNKQSGILSKIETFVRKDMTDNVCLRQKADVDNIIDQTSTARRLALAQGYAYSVASRRTAELFSRHAVPYLHSLTASDSEFNPKTIRQDIHLLLAADAGMIYLLGQINGLQGMISELQVLDNNLGGIKTFNGVTHSIGGFKTQEELCE